MTEKIEEKELKKTVKKVGDEIKEKKDVIKSCFKDFDEKKAFLDDLFYNVGKQKYDFELCYLSKEKDIKTKWKKYSDVGFDIENQKNRRAIEIANNRTILRNEVVLDLDNPELFKKLLEQLDNDERYYKVYKTGSKGYHFHLLFDGELTPEEKLEIIKGYKCDTQKASERTMIALEFTPHWKTEKPKELIIEKKGINKYIRKVLTEKEELEIIRENCLFYEYDKQGNLKKVKVLIPKITEYLLSQNNFKTIFGSKSEDIFIYQDGIYTKNGREIIQTQTEKILAEYCSNHYISEIVEKIKRSSAISREEFDDIPEELICLENGILNLKTHELLSHDPQYYFKNKLPIKYDKNATCPKIKKFFEEILYLEDIGVMQEWFGFNLYRRYFIKKAIIIFGETDTGKTVFLNLLITFLGEKNTTGISLQRVSSGDKFSLVSLKDKYANIHDDLSSKDLCSGGFKEATGGGYISAEYKFGDTFQFLTFAKHTFATNQIPSLKEIELNDEAYYNRWMPIPFDNRVEEKNQNKFFIKEITTEEELSGLLNYALEGLNRLLKNGRFSYNKSFKEIKTIMERHGNPLSTFCQDILVQKDGNRISKNAMFEIYSLYINNKGLARLSKEQLGRRLEKFVPYILAKHDAKERYWENVDINPNLNNDTLDTSIKSYIKNQKRDVNSLYMFSGEVSKVSQNEDFTHKTGEINTSTSFMSLKNGNPVEIKLEKGKSYDLKELCDNPAEVLEILKNEGKIVNLQFTETLKKEPEDPIPKELLDQDTRLEDKEKELNKELDDGKS